MLNEELEYLEYTLRTKKVFRFANKRDLLSLSGIRRGLEIIARKIYWKSNDFNLTVNALYSWMGFKLLDNSLSNNKDIKDLSGFFDGYYKNEFLDDYLNKKESNKKSFNDSLKTKLEDFDYKIFNEAIFSPVFKETKRVSKSNLKNSINAYSAYDIVSKAIQDGPLKIYYLLSDDCNILNNVISLETNKAVDVRRTDYILKEIAANLLAHKVDNQEYVYYPRVDLKNWCLISGNNDRYEPKTYRYLNNKNFEPFAYIKPLSVRLNNRSAYKINPEIMKHFKLVEADKLKEAVTTTKVECIYVDTASNDLFLKRVIVGNRKYKDIENEINQINLDSKKYLEK